MGRNTNKSNLTHLLRSILGEESLLPAPVDVEDGVSRVHHPRRVLNLFCGKNSPTTHLSKPRAFFLFHSIIRMLSSGKRGVNRGHVLGESGRRTGTHTLAIDQFSWDSVREDDRQGTPLTRGGIFGMPRVFVGLCSSLTTLSVSKSWRAAEITDPRGENLTLDQYFVDHRALLHTL